MAYNHEMTILSLEGAEPELLEFEIHCVTLPISECHIIAQGEAKAQQQPGCTMNNPTAEWKS